MHNNARPKTYILLTLLSHGERRSDASSKGLEFARASVMLVNAKNTNKRLRMQDESMKLTKVKENLFAHFQAALPQVQR